MKITLRKAWDFLEGLSALVVGAGVLAILDMMLDDLAAFTTMPVGAQIVLAVWVFAQAVVAASLLR